MITLYNRYVDSIHTEIYLDDSFGSEQKGICYEFKYRIDQTGVQPVQYDL